MHKSGGFGVKSPLLNRLPSHVKEASGDKFEALQINGSNKNIKSQTLVNLDHEKRTDLLQGSPAITQKQIQNQCLSQFRIVKTLKVNTFNNDPSKSPNSSKGGSPCSVSSSPLHSKLKKWKVSSINHGEKKVEKTQDQFNELNLKNIVKSCIEQEELNESNQMQIEIKQPSIIKIKIEDQINEVKFYPFNDPENNFPQEAVFSREERHKNNGQWEDNQIDDSMNDIQELQQNWFDPLKEQADKMEQFSILDMFPNATINKNMMKMENKVDDFKQKHKNSIINNIFSQNFSVSLKNQKVRIQESIPYPSILNSKEKDQIQQASSPLANLIDHKEKQKTLLLNLNDDLYKSCSSANYYQQNQKNFQNILNSQNFNLPNNNSLIQNKPKKQKTLSQLDSQLNIKSPDQKFIQPAKIPFFNNYYRIQRIKHLSQAISQSQNTRSSVFRNFNKIDTTWSRKSEFIEVK